MIFIDANQYLDLFRINDGAKLLELLEAQRSHIFVPQQTAAEVQRRKLSIAEQYLRQQLAPFDARRIGVPEQLFGSVKTPRWREKLQSLRNSIEAVNDEMGAATTSLLQEISNSEDEVSKALAPLFADAKVPTATELERARSRREVGNPPGKKGDPLGDQLAWEQVLAASRETVQVWIITRDSDYHAEYGGRAFLNPFLHAELLGGRAVPPTVFCFSKLAEGLSHSAEHYHPTQETVLSPQEIQRINREQDSWPAFDMQTVDTANYIAWRSSQRRRNLGWLLRDPSITKPPPSEEEMPMQQPFPGAT